LKRIVIENAAADGRPIARDHAIKTILRKNFRRRIDQGRVQLRGRAIRTDVGELRPQPRSFALDTVAGGDGCVTLAEQHRRCKRNGDRKCCQRAH
jgi:hypothetical protein